MHRSPLPMHATGPAHLILDLLTQTILCEEHRSLSALLSIFLHLVPLWPKYSPQHPILKHDQPTLLPQCEQLSLTPIQNNRQNYSSVHLYLYITAYSCCLTASSDKHCYRSSDSFFNIDANGFWIKLSTVLIYGQNANHHKTSALCMPFISSQN